MLIFQISVGVFIGASASIGAIVLIDYVVDYYKNRKNDE